MEERIEVINKARQHYKTENGVDIGFLNYAEQGFLVEVFIHGAEGVVKKLLSEAREKEDEFLQEDNS